MSKKRLEDALNAGKAIDSGEEIPKFFEKIEEHMTYEYDVVKFGVFTCQFSTEREICVIGYGDGSMEVLSTQSKKRQMDIKKARGAGLATSCVRFHPRQHFLFLAANASGHVYLCSHMDGTSEEIVTEPKNQINGLSFANDGLHFATCGSDCVVRVYDSNTAQVSHDYAGHQDNVSDGQLAVGHVQRIFAIKYHPDHDAVFVTGGWDNMLKIWDCRTKDGLMRSIPGPHICGDGIDIKGLQVLTASWVANNALEIYDFAMCRKLQTLPFPHEGSGQFLYSARFYENDIVVAGGSGTNSMKAIHIPSEKVVGEVSLGTHPVHTVDVIPGSHMISVGGAGNIFKVAKVE